MTFTLYPTLLAALIVAIVLSEDTALINTTAASTIERSDSYYKVRHLKGAQKTNNEERVGAVGATWYATHEMDSPSTSKFISQQSQKILDTTKDNTPLPKWAKVVVVLAGLGIVSGAAVLYANFVKAILDSK
ncbi:hypothetical protein F442_14841 [Phytophthora nicotianae P10297]|uniref:RxLR effector protein n=1 Tax=Phytophthora nicotianae P10297 TaxID=1317064 RepID=W2YRS4_PHYNI|nr:hypothetical protein F442_14841 [Phytophthora nicotianae P10297]